MLFPSLFRLRAVAAASACFLASWLFAAKFQFLPDNAAREGRFYVDIEDWTASTSADWLTLLDVSGSAGDALRFEAEENLSGELRVGRIEVNGAQFSVVQGQFGKNLFGIGPNQWGQLKGDGATSAIASPVEVFESGVADARVGLRFTAVLMEDGSLWGASADGFASMETGERAKNRFVKLADGVASVDASENCLAFITEEQELFEVFEGAPVHVADDVAQVSAGDRGYFFITTTGDLFGFTRLNGLTSRLGAGLIFGPLAGPLLVDTDVVDASLGLYAGAYVKSDGTLWAAGLGFSGLLGDDEQATFWDPVQIGWGVQEIEVGPFQIVMRKDDGGLYWFGSARGAFFGDGDPDARCAFEDAQLLAEDVGDFHLGRDYYGSLVYRDAAGDLIAHVGIETASELGLGSAPVELPGVVNYGSGMRSVSILSAQGSLGAFVGTDGSLTMAGYPLHQATGGRVDAPEGLESFARLDLTSIKQLVPGMYETMALDADGNLLQFGIGRDAEGALTPLPEATVVATDVSKFYKTRDMGALYLKDDASLWAYGWPGQPRVANRGSPTLVAEGVVDMAANGNAMYWVTEDGALYGMGVDGYYGWLGDYENNAVPNPLYSESGGFENPSITENIHLLDTQVVDVEAGSSSALYKKLDGSLWGIGSNSAGWLLQELSVFYAREPVKVVDSVDEILVDSRWDTAYYTKNGTLYGWGSNYGNQLGSQLQTVMEPVAIAQDVAQFAALENLAYILSDGSLWFRGTSFIDGEPTDEPELVATSASAVFVGSDRLYYETGQPVAAVSTRLEIGFEGGELDVAVGTGTEWVAFSHDDWIEILTPDSDGAGGTARASVGPNASPRARVGYINIGGVEFAVRQAAKPQAEGFQGGKSHVILSNEQSPAQQLEFYQSGEWSVSTDADWIELESSGGAGLGAIRFAVAPNHTGQPRVGVIEAGDYKYTIAQNAASYGSAYAGTMVYAAGSNSFGQARARGTVGAIVEPQFLMDGVRQVGAGGTYSLYLMQDYTLWAYGDHGLAGPDGNVAPADELTLVDRDVEKVSVGLMESTFSYITRNGELWRYRGEGARPSLIAPEAVDVEEGYFSFMYLTRAGDLFAESDLPGGYFFGRFGTGSASDPMERIHIASDVVDMAVGWFNSAYMKSDGAVWGAGARFTRVLNDQLAYPDATTYRQVATGAEAIEMGSSQLFIKTTDGKLLGVGIDEAPLFGRETGGPIPHELTLVGEQVDSFELSGQYEGALRITLESGESYVAGFNAHGQLGTGTRAVEQWSPALLGEGILSYSHTGAYSLTVDAEGRAWAAGTPPKDAVPLPDVQAYEGDALAPAPITGRAGRLIGGNGNVFLLDTSGALFGLGKNFSGQIRKDSDSSIDTWVRMRDDAAAAATYIGDGLAVATLGQALCAHGDFDNVGELQSLLETLYGAASVDCQNLFATGVSVGGDTIYYINAENQLKGFGSNFYGQLGLSESETGDYHENVISDH